MRGTLWTLALQSKALEAGLRPGTWELFFSWLTQRLNWKDIITPETTGAALHDIPRLVREFKGWEAESPYNQPSRQRARQLNRRSKTRRVKPGRIQKLRR